MFARNRHMKEKACLFVATSSLLFFLAMAIILAKLVNDAHCTTGTMDKLRRTTSDLFDCQIVLKETGMCLGHLEDKYEANVYHCNGESNQKWNITKAK